MNPSDDNGWRHLSPLSPILRGGIVLVAIVGYGISQLVGQIAPWLSGGPEVDEQIELATAHPLIALAALVLVVAAVGGGAWLSWRFARFRVSQTQVELRKGWLFREHRQVPIDRIQAVEVSRPLLAQVLGLAQVIVLSAGGGDSQLKLAFLPLAEANELRRHLQVLASLPGVRHPAAGQEPTPGAADPAEAGTPDASVHPGDAGQAAAPRPGPGSLPGELLGLGVSEGRPVVTVPNLRLLAATLLHSALLVPLFLITAGVGVGWAFGPEGLGVFLLASIPGIVPAAFGVAIYRVRDLLRNGNFALSDLGGAVRIVHGLTDHRTTTVPLHRIQAMEMIQPLWWRPMGWWRVHLNVAGTKSGDDGMTEETSALPVGPLEDALHILTLLDPLLERPALETASLGDGPAPGWALVSPRARWLDPWSWRRTGYAVSEHGVLIRHGRFSRQVVIVPHARIQSLTLRAGPLQRRLDLAGVHLISIPGPVKPHVPHLDLHAAEQLLTEQTARSREARAAARRADAPSAGETVAKPAPRTVDLGQSQEMEE